MRATASSHYVISVGAYTRDQWRGAVVKTSDGDHAWVLRNTATCLTVSPDSDRWYRKLRHRIPFLFGYQLPLEIRHFWRRVRAVLDTEQAPML